MSQSGSRCSLRYATSVGDLPSLEPLWNALQAHHSEITPRLAGQTPKRGAEEAWLLRRAKYERWLKAPDTFFVIAEEEEASVGYAFVTVGPGYASWATGERLAELETLSVLPDHRGLGVGSLLLDAVRKRLQEMAIDDLAVTTAIANVDSQRFYERHGLSKSFVVYYGKL